MPRLRACRASLAYTHTSLRVEHSRFLPLAPRARATARRTSTSSNSATTGLAARRATRARRGATRCAEKRAPHSSGSRSRAPPSRQRKNSALRSRRTSARRSRRSRARAASAPSRPCGRSSSTCTTCRARRRSRSRANRRATVGRARVPLGLPRGRFGVPSAPRFRAMAIGTSSSSARLPGAVRTGRPAMRPAPRRLWAEGIASEVAGSSAGRFQSSTGRDSQAGGPKGRSSPVGTAGAMALCLEPMPHVPPRRSGRWSLGARASGAPRSSVGRFPPSPQVALGFPPRQTSSAFARARRSNRREN